jgi:uncharacterized iron-regulated protein
VGSPEGASRAGRAKPPCGPLAARGKSWLFCSPAARYLRARMNRLLVVAWLGLTACGGQAAPGAAKPAQPAATRAAAVEPPRGANEAWLTRLDADNQLVGEIWDVRNGVFVTLPQLAEALAKARFVLLGEKHDNPDHHVLQAEVIERLVTLGRKPAVVLEMLEESQQPTIDQYVARPDATAAGFGAALGWEKTSWPPFSEYQPIFSAAFAHRLRLVAGNIAHADAKALVKQGVSALSAERAQRLRLDRQLPPQLEASLIDELRASHCGHLPERLLAPMALAQHARDAQMAKALAESGGSDGAVLIAGGGHARRDRGVPYYLSLEAPGATQASVVLREVRRGETDPKRYLDEEGPFDFVWFTPRASDEDPCAAFTAPPAKQPDAAKP